MPRDCLFDLWPVRECFADPFGRRPCFITAEDVEGRIQGLLALSWIEKQGSFGHFPGETWQGKTWLEQNRIIARRKGVADQLIDNVPGEAYIRYLTGESLLPEGLCVEPDETGYLFFPAECGYTFDRFMQRFSGKTVKNSVMNSRPSNRWAFPTDTTTYRTSIPCFNEPGGLRRPVLLPRSPAS